jgi:hypothetical protein
MADVLPVLQIPGDEVVCRKRCKVMHDVKVPIKVKGQASRPVSVEGDTMVGVDPAVGIQDMHRQCRWVNDNVTNLPLDTFGENGEDVHVDQVHQAALKRGPLEEEIFAWQELSANDGLGAILKERP